MNSTAILQQYWGYDSFRPLQEEIIEAILTGRDTLALMPTGGGKSLCYQVPALMKEGICIVISPLIALMKDQVEQLKKRGIEAVAIFSGMTAREVDITLDNCIFGKIKFLYLAPERLYSDLVRERIRYMKVNLFAIDEAHCISQWGYDFRPSYLQLISLRELHADIPFLAVTASATTRVVEDIQDKLQFKAPHVFRMSFERKNLGYMALSEEDKWGRMIRIIQKQGGAGVIYVRNRRETQEIARHLLNHGIPADYYHAGLSTSVRAQKQDEWMSNQSRVIVATNAFGMGIDKSDVRFVIHMDIPDSLEAYYQEAGRAGRDGKKAFPVLLYQQQDRDRLWNSLVSSFPSVVFIQQAYHHLCNHFQIAYGAGEGTVFDFDVIEFAKKYKIDLVETMSALKFLERDGWVSLSDAVFIPARFKFEIDYQELYKYQISNAKFEGLIKAILRSYGGVFDFHIHINEYEFAKKLKMPYEEIVKMLMDLQKQGVATYLKSTDAPQLQFLQNRVDYKNLYIDTQFIKERKVIKEEQLKAIYNYLDAKECRSIALLQYFGEQNAPACGECDLCLTRKHRSNQERKIRHEIQHILIDSPLGIHHLVDRLTIGDDDIRLKVIRKLLDEELLIVQDEHYYWKAVF